jgi:hypothetical protein
VKPLVNTLISQPRIEYVLETVLYGNLRRPAVRRSFKVHAETSDAAKRVLKYFYPRSGEYSVLSARRLDAIPALVE